MMVMTVTAVMMVMMMVVMAADAAAMQVTVMAVAPHAAAMTHGLDQVLAGHRRRFQGLGGIGASGGGHHSGAEQYGSGGKQQAFHRFLPDIIGAACKPPLRNQEPCVMNG